MDRPCSGPYDAAVRVLRGLAFAAVAACGLDVVGTPASTSPVVSPEGGTSSIDGGAIATDASPPTAAEDAEADAAADAPPPAPFVPADLVLWLDAERIDGLANGAEVASWNDASGNGRNATQTTASRRPKYMTNVVGGKPAVRFDGTGTFLLVPSFALFPTSSSPLSVVVVFAASALGAQRFLLMQPQTNCTNNFELGYRTGNANRANFGLHAGCSHADVTTTDIDMQWHVFTTVIAATGTKPSNVELFRDGTKLTTQADANGWPSAGSYGTQSRKLVVGARDDNNNNSYNSFHSGDIAEIMVFNVALAPATRGMIEAHLKGKYGL